MDATILADDIRDAAAVLDRARADRLATELAGRIADPAAEVPPAAVHRALDALRRKRWFAPLERIGAAAIAAGRDDAKVRRIHAQALIDDGHRLGEAIRFLEELVRSTADGEAENAEARGLLGRAFKQRYVGAVGHDAGDADDLRAAIGHYHGVYHAAPERHTWHGINTVALLARAERDRVAVGSRYPAPAAMAAEILRRIDDLGDATTVWDAASALEACVALGRVPRAAEWAKAYAANPAADAFEIGSTLRQMVEVWQLTTSGEMGAAVLPWLRDALLRRENGFFEVAPQEMRAALEKVFGTDGFVTYGRYAEGLERARSVARVGPHADEGWGTGFLVRASDLHPAWAEHGLVLVTNAHVVGPPIPNQTVLAPEEAVVVFEALGADVAYRTVEQLWTSPPEDCDCTVLTLRPVVEPAPPITPYEVAPRLPGTDGKQRVYIIGHPGGRSLSFSIHDNLLLDHDERLLHYRTPTEGGSSGSPVFNTQWKLVALHHAGSHQVPRLNGKEGAYAANEGISIAAIRAAIAAEVGGG